MTKIQINAFGWWITKDLIYFQWSCIFESPLSASCTNPNARNLSCIFISFYFYGVIKWTIKSEKFFNSLKKHYKWYFKSSKPFQYLIKNEIIQSSAPYSYVNRLRCKGWMFFSNFWENWLTQMFQTNKIKFSMYEYIDHDTRLHPFGSMESLL